MKEIRYCIYSNNKIINVNETVYGKFFSHLENEFKFVEDKDEPRYVFSDECTIRHLKHKSAIRIQWSAENIPPNFFEYDYIIGTSRLIYGNRYLYIPAYAYPSNDNRGAILGLDNLIPLTQNDLEKKEYFCNFVYSNKIASPMRTKCFEEISKYKFVHAPGAVCNNTPSIPRGENWQETFELKMDYQKKFKFTLAIENTSTPGYISEKIFNAFTARTIPIYWGDPTINEAVNSKSFINIHDFSDFESLIKRVKEIDEDDDQFLEMVNTLPLLDVRENNVQLLDESVEDFLRHIFSDPYGKRDCDCKLWCNRYEKRYLYGTYNYEFYRNAIGTLYNFYKRIKH